MSKEERTAANVKGMPARVWECAKDQAQPFGVWLGRASGHPAALEDSLRELSPLAPLPCRAIPDELPPARPDAQAAPVGGPPGLDASAQGPSAVAVAAATAGAVPLRGDMRRA